jgi:hypothetical protein
VGRIYAEGLASSGLDIEDAIAMHLQGNHYPPVPVEMVKACIQAIDCYNNGFDTDLPIALPEIDGFQVTYKGRTTAPAWSIIEQHHLDTWLVSDEPIWED